jgi:hypothetical protein
VYIAFISVSLYLFEKNLKLHFEHLINLQRELKLFPVMAETHGASTAKYEWVDVEPQSRQFELMIFLP